MGRCVAFGCKEIASYKFPSHPNLRRKWEKALRRVNFKASAYSRLCRKHFKDTDFETISKETGFPLQRKFLKKSAVPTVFSWNNTSGPNTSSRAERLERRNTKHYLISSTVTSREKDKTLHDKITNVSIDQAYAHEKSLKKQNGGYDMANDEPPGDELPDDTADDGTIDHTQTDVVPDGEQNESIQETLTSEITSDNQPPVNDYCCDGCKKNITGFRYTCVQCADYDLCGACERLMLHAQHYVLRVPPGKSAKEVRLILETIRMKLDTIEDDLMLLNYGIVKIKKEEDEFEEVTIEDENLILPTTVPESVADASSRRDEVPNVVKTATGDGDENVGNEDDMSFSEDWLDEPLLEMYADPLQAVAIDTVEPSISKQSGERHVRNIERLNKEPIIKLLSPLERHDSDKQSGPKICSLPKLPPCQILKRKSEITNSEPKKLLLEIHPLKSEPKKLLLEIHPLKISDGRATQSVSSQPTSTSRESDVTKEEGSESYAFLHTYAKKPSSDPRLSTDSKFIEKKYVKRKDES